MLSAPLELQPAILQHAWIAKSPAHSMSDGNGEATSHGGGEKTVFLDTAMTGAREEKGTAWTNGRQPPGVGMR